MPTKCFLICYLAGFLATIASACSAPSAPHVAKQQYPSIYAGLQAVARQVLIDSVKRDTEYAGAIVLTPEGSYRISIAQGCRRKDRVRFALPGPAYGTVVALWHTHGRQRYEADVFSSRDARTVRETGLPFYLITPRQSLRVLTPSSLRRKAGSFRSAGPRGYPGLFIGFTEEH